MKGDKDGLNGIEGGNGTEHNWKTLSVGEVKLVGLVGQMQEAR